MAETYWEVRAQLIAERDAAVEPPAPKKSRAAKAAPVEQPPAAETPGDPGLNPKE